MAETATVAPVVLACPSRVGTDTSLSRTMDPHPVRRSSSSLDLRCSPHDLARRRTGPRGVPAPDPLEVLVRNHLSASSMSLASPSARQLPTWISLLIRLSWVSPAFVPCLRFHPLRSLPVDVAASLRCAGSTRCTSRSILVDSHHLDGFLRSGARACCIPIRTGFAAFPDARTRSLAS